MCVCMYGNIWSALAPLQSTPTARHPDASHSSASSSRVCECMCVGVCLWGIYIAHNGAGFRAHRCAHTPIYAGRPDKNFMHVQRISMSSWLFSFCAIRTQMQNGSEQDTTKKRRNELFFFTAHLCDVVFMYYLVPCLSHSLTHT